MSDSAAQPENFPEVHWDEIRTRMEKEGPLAVIAFIDSIEGPGAQLNLYAFAQRAFGSRDWQGKNFDALIEVTDAGIRSALAVAAGADDEKKAAAIIDFGNTMSYNLAADLAACWPGDEAPREQRHFERGLAAADACLDWRRQLKKDDYPFAIAYWARGMHLLSLGRGEEAVEAMQAAVKHSIAHAEANELSTAIETDGDFMVILNQGYLGLAQAMAGDDRGRELFNQACKAFEDTLGDKAEDAQFGLEQLRHVGLKFL